MVLVGLLKRIATTYAITNHRLYIRRGVIARNVEQTRLDRVQGVNTHQGVIERILQVGTVDFDTAGHRRRRLRLPRASPSRRR